MGLSIFFLKLWLHDRRIKREIRSDKQIRVRYFSVVHTVHHVLNKRIRNIAFVIIKPPRIYCVGLRETTTNKPVKTAGDSSRPPRSVGAINYLEIHDVNCVIKHKNKKQKTNPTKSVSYTS